MVFPKNLTGTWSFLYYQERSYLFFLKIWSYTLGGKWKMIFLKKIHGNMIFSSNFLKRWSFQKGRAVTWSFLYSLERWYFFPENIFFPWAEGERWHSSVNTWKYDSFCVHVRVLQTWSHASLSKKSKTVLSRKNIPKGIDVLDWHPRKSSSNSLYFQGGLYRRFHVPLSSEKKQKT